MRLRRLAGSVGLTVTVAFVGGCMKELPTAPTEVTTGITIYEHANFTGGSALLTTDVSNLADYKGPCKHTESGGDFTTSTTYDWSDCISSIKVAPGWRATVYADSGFHEDWLELTADAPNFALVRGYCEHDTWNDCISSIRVRRQ
jgi:hypothetical protein